MSLPRIATFATLAFLAACSAGADMDPDPAADGPIDHGAAALTSAAAAGAGAAAAPNECRSLVADRKARTVAGRQVVDVKLTVNHGATQDLELCVGEFATWGLRVDPASVGVRVEGSDPTKHAAVDRVAVTHVPGAPSAGTLTIPYQAKPGFAGLDKMKIVTGQYDFDIEIRVKPFTVRAIGDSVTAGFGYYADGTSMTPDAWGIKGEERLDPIVLVGCKPMSSFLNNRCSSNSATKVHDTSEKVSYAMDFGYENQVSWAAQLARMIGVPAMQKADGVEYRTYANFAITGSEPGDWGGVTSHAGATPTWAIQEIAAAQPDLTVMTLGANPLLSELLLDHAGECEEAARNYKLGECVAKYVKKVDLRSRMVKALLTQLYFNETNHVLVMLYPNVWPAISIYSPQMIGDMAHQINVEIAAAARQVQENPRFAKRIVVASPPEFHFGAPMNPFLSTCDGPSKQARITQDLFSTKPIDMMKCTSKDYWVISGDTGVHPSKAGYTQMAKSAYEALRELDLPLPCKGAGTCPK